MHGRSDGVLNPQGELHRCIEATEALKQCMQACVSEAANSML